MKFWIKTGISHLYEILLVWIQYFGNKMNGIIKISIISNIMNGIKKLPLINYLFGQLDEKIDQRRQERQQILMKKNAERNKKLCRYWAKRFNILSNVHPKDYIWHFLMTSVHTKDYIWHFLMTSGGFKNTDDATKHYFVDGNKSAKNLADIIYNELGYSQNSRIKLFEFASGYGCVTRHLKNILGNNVEITSCDIHKEAMDFIKKKMKIKTILSHNSPEEFQIKEKYDIVFVLSFFSHIPEKTWGRWLQKIFSCVAKHGHLIFTTHSTESLKYLGFPKISSSGFWFRPDSEQKDLNVEEYGLTVALPKYVKKEINIRTKSPLVLFKHAFSWGHQDLYVVAKL